jgi:hypothetical protein
MSIKLFLLGMVILSLAGIGTVTAVTQEPQEDVRGAFLTTRPKPTDRSSKGSEPRPSRRRPKPVTKATPLPNAGNKPVVSPSPIKDPVKVEPQKLGLGLTLLSRDSLGLTVRIDPTSTFRKGDRVRVLLETNTEGHLYIFNTTNGGKPVMIYPNKELDEGGNYLTPHVPFEIPSSTASEERLRWLVFDEFAGEERLYFVFSREPLPGIPIEDDLIAFCNDEKNRCPLEPSEDVWTKILKELDEPLRIDTAKRFGKAQTEPEREAIERGLGLSTQEPEPSLIMMSSSAKSGTLVTVLDLVHK